MTHPGILFMRALSHLPLGAVRGLGTLLGRLLFVLARSRRRVALINLRLAYPQWSEAERVALARRNFVYFAQAFLDRSWLWHAHPGLVRQRLRITGAVDDLTREGAVVMFAPHFYGMDAGGSAVMQQIDRPACTIYSTQPNPALDEWMQPGRQRFGDATLLSRTEGILPALEPAHALAHVARIAPKMSKDKIIVMNLCGRGDKDIFALAERLGVKL